MTGARLHLVGDDEVLDVLAELSRHLDYVEIARSDELPSEPLGPDDHLLIATRDEALGLRLLANALGRGAPGYAGLVPDHEGDSTGARAIVAAAELISALHDRR